MKRVYLYICLLFFFIIFNHNLDVYAECSSWYFDYSEGGSDDGNYMYTGKAIKPNVEVYADAEYYNELYNLKPGDPDYAVNCDALINSSDYTVIYSKGCKNVGKYTIKVQMKDGTTNSSSYYIIPKSTKISKYTGDTNSINIKWKPVKKQINGYQIKYSKKKNFSKSKTITVKGNKKTSTEITGLNDNTAYYVKIRSYKTVSGKKWYSDWSEKKKIKTKKIPSGLDYDSASQLEKALNKGVDCTGKTARIKISDFKPDSLFGYNLWAGKHLNLVSSTHPGVGKGDTITIRITRVENFLGSWLIYYERI